MTNRLYTPPAHYQRSDGALCCAHAIPVAPGSCPECHSLTDEHRESGCTCVADMYDQAAADDLLHQQTIGQWPGIRCEITIDVFTSGSKRQIRRITPMHDDIAITRVLLAEELRQLADGIERLGFEAAGGQS